MVYSSLTISRVVPHVVVMNTYFVYRSKYVYMYVIYTLIYWQPI